MASGDQTPELTMIDGTDNIPIIKELVTTCVVC
jgi:hypothetical protein